MKILIQIAVFLLVAAILVAPTIALSSELDCLATNIYFESRGEPEAGQFLTGFITMNRVNDKRWPNTVCKVVYQPGQFEWTEDAYSNKVYKGSEQYKRIIYIASIVMQSKEIQHYGYFFNTTHSKSKSIVVAGNHRFY